MLGIDSEVHFGGLQSCRNQVPNQSASVRLPRRLPERRGDLAAVRQLPRDEVERPLEGVLAGPVLLGGAGAAPQQGQAHLCLWRGQAERSEEGEG